MLKFRLTYVLLKNLGWFRSKWNNMQNRDNSGHNSMEIDENLDIDSGDQSRK